jgi:hypothetical protein
MNERKPDLIVEVRVTSKFEEPDEPDEPEKPNEPIGPMWGGMGGPRLPLTW